MIHGRRVLCAARSALGHTIPTAALALEFQRAGNDVTAVTYFGKRSDLYRRLGLPTQDLRPASPREAVAVMIELIREYDPDITVCDWQHDLWLAQRTLPPRCRVSILRCEQFLGYQRRSPFLPDSFGLGSPLPANAPENTLLRLFKEPLLEDRRALYRTEAIVVPSLPELDPPPPHPEQAYPDSVFVYTGPLQAPCFDRPAPEVQAWTARERQGGRRVLLVTAGTVARGTDLLLALARAMARAPFSCVMAVANDETQRRLSEVEAPHLLVVAGAALRDLVAACDLVVHHCGHGTLQTVLQAGKPSITLPSYEYDREDNALRLEDLGCGIHLSDAFYRRDLDMDLLAGTIEQVLGDPRIGAAVASMSRRITEFGAQRGPGHLLRVLAERDLVDRPARRRTRPALRSRPRRAPWPTLRLLRHALGVRLAAWRFRGGAGRLRVFHNRDR